MNLHLYAFCTAFGAESQIQLSVCPSRIFAWLQFFTLK
jgi:hypothetical protein